MSSSNDLCRTVLVFLLLLLLMQGVSAWAVQNLLINPDKEPILPQTPVTLTYSVHFDSWLTGLTFPSQNTLDMYTDLSDAQWVVTKTEIITDQPSVTTPVVTKQGLRVRLDGWTLSYARRQIDVNVQLKGVAPNVTQSQDKIIIKVQEFNPDGQVIASTVMSKKYQIYVPTPVPATSLPTPVPATSLPTPVQTPTEIIRTPDTMVTSVTPTRKETYSPGPEPCAIVGMLAVLVIILAGKMKK
jgi:hypothetical protein